MRRSFLNHRGPSGAEATPGLYALLSGVDGALVALAGFKPVAVC